MSNPREQLYKPEQGVAIPPHIAQLGELNSAPAHSDIRLDLTHNLATVQTESGSQALRAVVGAKNTFFGVIECSTVDNEHFYAVTRIASGSNEQEQGSLVNIFSGDNGDSSVIIGDQEDAVRVGLGITYEGDLKVVNSSAEPLYVTGMDTISEGAVGKERTGLGGLKRMLRWRRKEQLHSASWELNEDDLQYAKTTYQIAQRIRGTMRGNKNLPQHEVDFMVDKVMAESNPNAAEILRDGAFRGKPVGTVELIRNAHHEISQREYMASVAKRSPDAAEALVAREVAGFHGARSSTLASVLEFGGKLLSARAVHEEKRGILVAGGDAFTMNNTGRFIDQIPFAALTVQGVGGVFDVYAGAQQNHRTVKDLYQEAASCLRIAATKNPEDTYNLLRYRTFADGLVRAAQYIEQHPDSTYAQLMLDSFPVLFGVGRDAMNRGASDPHELIRGSSTGLDEFRPLSNELSLAEGDVPVIAVPRDRVAAVQQMLDDRKYPVKALAIEDLKPKRHFDKD